MQISPHPDLLQSFSRPLPAAVRDAKPQVGQPECDENYSSRYGTIEAKADEMSNAAGSPRLDFQPNTNALKGSEKRPAKLLSSNE